MRYRIVGVTLAAALVLGGATIMGDLPVGTSWSSPVVAHAAATVISQGTLGSCPWKLTSDGVMHVGEGTLPAAKETIQTYPDGTHGYNWTSPFVDVMNDFQTVVKTISFDGPIKAPENASHLFYGLNNANSQAGSNLGPQIAHLDRLDVSQTTNMAEMFSSSGQQTLDVSDFNTSNVKTMQGMFEGNNDLTSNIVGLDKFNTSKVTDMGKMFYEIGNNSYNVTLDLSHFDVRQVTGGTDELFGEPQAGFYQMFYLSGPKATVNLAGWQPQVPLDNLIADGTNLAQITLSPDINLTADSLPTTNNDTSALTQKWENSRDLYSNAPDKVTYTLDGISKLYSQGNTDKPTTDETYVWVPAVTPGNPVVVHYVDENGKTIQADQSVPGDLGKSFTITPQEVKGYHYVKAEKGSLTGTYTSEPQEVTLVYKADPTPSTTGSATESTTASSSSDTTESQPDQVTKTFPVAKQDRTLTAVKKMGLYRTPNFSKKTRVFYYNKQARTKRPQFVITGMAKSVNGTPRYLVKDVTQGSKRRGKTGYVTVNQNFWVHSYYQQKPKAIRVIAKDGVDAYRSVTLAGKSMHYQKGKVLRVKQLKRYHLTTRLQLSNGRYVTANKNFVIQK